MTARFRRVAAVAAAVPVLAHAQWTAQVEAGVAHEDNFSRAQRAQDRIADTVLVLGAGIERPLSFAADVSVGADARLARYAHSHGASHAGAGFTARSRTKLGLGLTAPWVATRASAALENAREPVRDATRLAAAAEVGRRFVPRFEASAGLAYDRRVQRDDLPLVPGYSGKPFSLQGRSFFARASYDFAGGVALIGAAALRKGDIESSTRRNAAIFSASNAIAADPALGPDFIAYRLSGARTTTFSAALSWPIGRHAALEASAARDDTAAGQGLDYVNRIYGLTFVWRR